MPIEMRMETINNNYNNAISGWLTLFISALASRHLIIAEIYCAASLIMPAVLWPENRDKLKNNGQKTIQIISCNFTSILTTYTECQLFMWLWLRLRLCVRQRLVRPHNWGLSNWQAFPTVAKKMNSKHATIFGISLDNVQNLHNCRSDRKLTKLKC